MLMDRIIGAFTFRRGVYAEVEKDTTFTTTAWLLVVVIGFLNQVGTHASPNPIRWLVGSIVGTLFVVIAFAAAAFVVDLVGRTVFHADVIFNELVRTLGLAYVWNIVGLIGGIAALSPVLGCLTAPAVIAGAILGLIAWFVAAKEALDLEWVPTVVTVIIGWIVLVAIIAIGGVLLALAGLGAAALGGLLA
jgi:hypothetical protein